MAGAATKDDVGCATPRNSNPLIYNGNWLDSVVLGASYYGRTNRNGAHDEPTEDSFETL